MSVRQCGLVNSNDFSSTQPVEPKLRLNEFKTLFKAWRRGIPWWDHLLLGLLVWLEDKFIDLRVQSELDQAVEDYKKIEPSLPDYVTPVYTETPSESSTGLPEMRLTAPWYKETKE